MPLNHDGKYATFKQWPDLGGHIRKGGKSEIVAFRKIQPIEEELEDGTKIVNWHIKISPLSIIFL